MKDSKFSWFLRFLTCLPSWGAEVKMKGLQRGSCEESHCSSFSTTDIRGSNIA